MNKKLLIVFLGILAAMAPLATDMYLPSLPEIQREFGTGPSVIQMTLTMTMLGMAIGQILAGPISDMEGRKRPLLVGMLIFAAASVVCALVSNIYVFLAARLVQGLAGACGIVVARAIARDVCQGSDLTTFYAILMMINGLAPIMAPVIGGQLLLLGSWHLIFAALTVVGIVMALATMVYKETLPVSGRIKSIKATLRVMPKLLRDRYFMGHCLLQSFIYMSFFCYIGCSSFIYQGIFGVSAQGYSYIFGGVGVGLLLAGTIPARLAGRVSENKMLFYAILVQIISSVLLFAVFMTANNFYLVVVLMALCVIPISVLATVSFSMALNRQGKNAGSASALLGFFSMFLGALIMPVAGYFGTDTGVPMSVIMMIGFAVGMYFYWIMVRPEHDD